MNAPRECFLESGFTLVEMLAALFGVFLLAGSGTGFLLTAMERQAAVLRAAALEGQHEALAEIMSDSLKSAVDFQIYDSAPAKSESEPLTPGVPAGDCLVCIGQGVIYEFYLKGNQIEYDQTVNGSVQTRIFSSASKVGQSLFNMNQGILQAQWNLTTTIDSVPFNVYGMPLPMR